MRGKALPLAAIAAMGLIALALAMLGAAVTVTDFLFQADTVWVTGVLVFALFATLWFVLPLLRRRRNAIEDRPSG